MELVILAMFEIPDGYFDERPGYVRAWSDLLDALNPTPTRVAVAVAIALALYFAYAAYRK